MQDNSYDWTKALNFDLKRETPLRKNQEDLSVGIQLKLTTVILFSVSFDVHPTNQIDHIVHWCSTVWFTCES